MARNNLNFDFWMARTRGKETITFDGRRTDRKSCLRSVTIRSFREMQESMQSMLTDPDCKPSSTQRSILCEPITAAPPGR